MYGGLKPKSFWDYEGRLRTDRICRNYYMLDMDFGQLQYMIDSAEILETISKWQKKSDNEELQKISEATLRLVFYINQLELERYSFKRILREERQSVIRAVERARRVEKELENLKENKYGL